LKPKGGEANLPAFVFALHDVEIVTAKRRFVSALRFCIANLLDISAALCRLWQPGRLFCEIRGFASPSRGGFAFSETLAPHQPLL